MDELTSREARSYFETWRHQEDRYAVHDIKGSLWSFADLVTATDRLCETLGRRGITSDQSVILCAPPGFAWLVAWFALLRRETRVLIWDPTFCASPEFSDRVQRWKAERTLARWALAGVHEFGPIHSAGVRTIPLNEVVPNEPLARRAASDGQVVLPMVPLDGERVLVAFFPREPWDRRGILLRSLGQGNLLVFPDQYGLSYLFSVMTETRSTALAIASDQLASMREAVEWDGRRAYDPAFWQLLTTRVPIAIASQFCRPFRSRFGGGWKKIWVTAPPSAGEALFWKRLGFSVEWPVEAPNEVSP